MLSKLSPPPCFILLYSVEKKPHVEKCQASRICFFILFSFSVVAFLLLWPLDIAVHFLVPLASFWALGSEEKKLRAGTPALSLCLTDLITSWSRGLSLPVFLLASLLLHSGPNSMERWECTHPMEARTPTAMWLSCTSEHLHECLCAVHTQEDLKIHTSHFLPGKYLN